MFHSGKFYPPHVLDHRDTVFPVSYIHDNRKSSEKPIVGFSSGLKGETGIFDGRAITVGAISIRTIFDRMYSYGLPVRNFLCALYLFNHGELGPKSGVDG